MSKRILPLLILSLHLLPLCNAHFLWRVDTEIPSYLYGTVHSSDRSVRELPPEVVDALKRSRSFHPELAFSPETMGQLTAAIFAPTGSDSAADLPAPLWARLISAADKAGIPASLVRRIPIQLLPLVFSAPPESNFNKIVDVQVYQLAKEHGLEIEQLETVDEQIGLFRNLSRDDAIRFLGEALEEYEIGFPAHQTLLEFYSRGDLDGLMTYFSDEIEKVDLPELARDLVEHRNHRMAERLQPALEVGGAFAAVGVAHFPGDEGIVELLRKSGWTVTRVSLKTEVKETVPGKE